MKNPFSSSFPGSARQRSTATLCLAALLLALPIPALAQRPTSSLPPWTTSRITGSPNPPPRYATERVFPSLEFDQPVELVTVPGTSRFVVLEVTGKIFSFENRPTDENLKPELFADIKLRDPSFTRLYGLAFHPRFTENRFCYISYVLKNQTPDGSRVSRFRVTATDPPRLDPDSEEVVLTWYGGGHNGAHLQFGPDGRLYISTGDGGNAFPPDGRNSGQDLSDLEASILRIDVDHRDRGLAYRIPPDNPFVGHSGCRGEIWAYGLRNPWKMCFDPADGSLWVGDVGWEMWELVYRIDRGANYGWSVVEGPQPVHQERATGPTPIVPPTVAHSHIEARSITGGYFSQTSRLPELRGAYIYGDYVTGKIWGLKHEGATVTWREELVDTPLQPASFGLDPAGDILIVDHPTGTLHRLIDNPRRTANADFPRKLSETGLFADTARHIPAPGVVPYSVTAEPWADGALSHRFIALPGNTQLGTYKKTNAQVGYFAGEWQFPDGGVLVKTISLDVGWDQAAPPAAGPPSPALPSSPSPSPQKRRLETQILHFDVDTWKAYNYIWNDEQTDAVLADNIGADRTGGWDKLAPASAGPPSPPLKQIWHHSSRTECLLCHTTRVGSILGFKPQLLTNLSALDSLGLFADPPPTNRPAIPNPHDESAPLEARARAYLHVNCGHCHTRGGGGSSFFDVQYQLPLAKTALIGSRPTQGTFGIFEAEIIAPRDPYRSVLYYRMSKLGHGRMPQIGSSVIDSRGTKLIREWIASLKLPADDAAGKKSLPIRERQAAEFAVALSHPGPTEGDISKLLSSPSTALALADSIVGWNDLLYGTPKELVISRGYAHPDPAIRDLFERFIPLDQRIQRLGGSIKSADILALTGDAARGRALFFDAAGIQCKNCHKIGDQGQSLGPELSQIGKKLDKPKLLESILEPSKTIDPQFVSHLVETTSGEVHTGLLVRRDETELVLRKADAKEIAIPASQIERASPQQKSLMPDLLLRDLTPQQAADLLEYLANLK